MHGALSRALGRNCPFLLFILLYRICTLGHSLSVRLSVCPSSLLIVMIIIPQVETRSAAID